jgi:hypothetical protein
LDYQADQNGQSHIEVTAADAETTTTTTFVVTVLPINDPPIHGLPGPQTTLANNPLLFLASYGNPITIADVDVGIAAIETLLQVTSGTLKVSGAPGANVSGDETAQVTINGPVAGVNAALNGLAFLPPADFVGSVTLSVTSRDFGNTGAGGPQSQTDTLEILVGRGPAVTADIVDVSPNPRAAPVDEITLQFTRPVTGLDLGDLSLTRSTDTTISLLPGPATLATSNAATYTVGALSDLTAASGIYQLALTAAGSGIQSSDGGALAGDAIATWIHGAGDADGDRRFDPTDLVLVLQAGKYLTGQSATWSEGDWNGDGVFNPLDIVAAQQTLPGHYLQGPFAASASWSSIRVDSSIPSSWGRPGPSTHHPSGQDVIDAAWAVSTGSQDEDPESSLIGATAEMDDHVLDTALAQILSQH